MFAFDKLIKQIDPTRKSFKNLSQETYQTSHQNKTTLNAAIFCIVKSNFSLTLNLIDPIRPMEGRFPV